MLPPAAGERLVVRRFVLISIISAFCLSGCDESYKGPAGSSDQSNRLDVRVALIQRLQDENLPALKSVGLWQNDYGPGLKLTTPHYEIYTTLIEPLMLRQVPGFIESAHRGYNDQLPEPIETRTAFTVYFFADREEWEDFTRTFAGERAELLCKIKAGAYYLNGACVTYNIGRRRTFAALGHEGWHQFNGRHFKFRLPSWLDEGVAMLFEASRCQNGLFYFEPSWNVHRLSALKETLARNEQLPLEELIAMNPGEVLATDQTEAVKAFYSQSYALVRFLQEADNGKYLENYRRLLLGGLTGSWQLSDKNKKIAADRNIARTVRWNRIVGPKLFKQYVGDDLDKIEREYLAFCRRIASTIR
jgi:hypothetical protein